MSAAATFDLTSVSRFRSRETFFLACESGVAYHRVMRFSGAFRVTHKASFWDEKKMISSSKSSDERLQETMPKSSSGLDRVKKRGN